MELIIEPADEPLPRDKGGQVNLDLVTHVRVISIRRHHA
jgi:hypothetical protein